MDLLAISPSHVFSSFSSRRLTRSLSELSHSSFNPQISVPSRFRPLTTSLRCALTTSSKPSEGPEFQNPNVRIRLSSSQAPATSTRGAEADAMGLLLRERIVFLGSNIDDFVADAITGQLLLLDAQDATKDIKLFINSPGGSLSATLAIYDAVQLVRADVSTIAFGMAASTASIILGGGTKGKRLAMPNTRIMMHQPLAGLSGQAIDVEIQAREAKHNKENVIKIISGFTGRSYEQIEKDIDRDRYMSPMEAVEFGVLDGVIERERVISTLNYEEISEDLIKFLI